MKFKSLFSISIILFIFLLMSGTAFAANPIQISTFEQLMSIDDSVENLSKDYILMNDIDVQNSTLFKPIGFYSYNTITREHTGDPFTGTFNGNGYTISNITFSNITFSNNNTMTIGLFGGTEGASISNLSLKNINFTGQWNVGGLVGMANTTSITNCSVVNSNTCLISGNGRVGGFVGYLQNSNISDSYATSTVIGEISVGGFIGSANNSLVSYSYATGNVESESFVGGFAGYIHNNSSISKSYATGNVTIKAIENETKNAIDNETKNAIGNVADVADTPLSDTYFGGFVGFMTNNSSISKSYAIGNVKGAHSVGGFAGGMYGSAVVSESYATGNADGIDSIGGFVGNMWSSSVSYCYAIGNSKKEGYHVGGFAGDIRSSSVISCFSPTEAGRDNGLSIVKLDADLKKKKTFDITYPIIPLSNPATFSKPWSISSSPYSNATWYIDENNDYPKLLWNDSSSSALIKLPNVSFINRSIGHVWDWLQSLF
jgi:The GLUG motif.